MANTKTGRVVKNVSDKTITVLVVTYKNHPLYRKRFVYSKKYLVHDSENQAKTDDMVVIRQSRPISRQKRWVLEKVNAHNAKTKAEAVKSVAKEFQVEEEKPEEKEIPKSTPKEKPSVKKAVKSVSKKEDVKKKVPKSPVKKKTPLKPAKPKESEK